MAMKAQDTENASDQTKKILALIPCSHLDLEMLSVAFYCIRLHMNIYIQNNCIKIAAQEIMPMIMLSNT